MAENDIRTINFDNPIINCPNPNCDNKITITIEQILKKESVICSRCSSTINIYDANGSVQMVSELKECTKSLKGFSKSLEESTEKFSTVHSHQNYTNSEDVNGFLFYLAKEQPEYPKMEELQMRKCKEKIEAFVKMNVDENIKFPNLNINYDKNYAKALQKIFKTEDGIDIDFTTVDKLITDELYKNKINAFKISLLNANKDFNSSSKIIQDWVDVYINTFGNSINYCHLAQFTNWLSESNVPIEYNEDFIHQWDAFMELYTEANEIGYINEVSPKIFHIRFNSNLVFNHEQYKEQNMPYLKIMLNFENLINKTIEEKSTLILAENLSKAMANGEKLINMNELTIECIDKMTGLEFEHFLCKLFSEYGYKAEVTKSTGDQGADLIVEKFGERIVVQAKRYSSDVSNSAIQEVVAAKAYYNSNKAMVITNSYFTKSAVELAYSNNVELCDREQLEQKIKNYNANKIGA